MPLIYNRVLEAIENAADAITITNVSESVVIVQKSFAVSVQQVNTDDFSKSGQTFSVNIPDFRQHNISSEHISFDSVSSSSPIGSIQLPSNLLSSISNNSSSKITHAVFVTDSLFLRRGFSYDKVGSIILSASVVGIGTLRGLRPPVNLGFQLNPVRVMKVEVKLNFILCRMLMDHFQNVVSGTNP